MNLIEDAAPPPFAARSESLAVGVDDPLVDVGDAIAVRARIFAEDDAAEPPATEAVLIRDEVPVARTTLTPDEAGGGLLRGTLPAPAEPGRYEVALQVEGQPESSDVQLRVPVLVTDPAREAELRRRSADAETMRSIAALTGGTFFREGGAGGLASQFDGLSETRIDRREVNLSTSWPPFVAAVTALTIEWFLRRRRGLM
jgi:hypothetical protein